MKIHTLKNDVFGGEAISWRLITPLNMPVIPRNLMPHIIAGAKLYCIIREPIFPDNETTTMLLNISGAMDDAGFGSPLQRVLVVLSDNKIPLAQYFFTAWTNFGGGVSVVIPEGDLENFLAAESDGFVATPPAELLIALIPGILGGSPEIQPDMFTPLEAMQYMCEVSPAARAFLGITDNYRLNGSLVLRKNNND